MLHALRDITSIHNGGGERQHSNAYVGQDDCCLAYELPVLPLTALTCQPECPEEVVLGAEGSESRHLGFIKVLDVQALGTTLCL